MTQALQGAPAGPAAKPKTMFGEPPRTPESEILQFHQDVARSAQWVLEEILLEKVRYLAEKVPSRNLCMCRPQNSQAPSRTARVSNSPSP